MGRGVTSGNGYPVNGRLGSARGAADGRGDELAVIAAGLRLNVGSASLTADLRAVGCRLRRCRRGFNRGLAGVPLVTDDRYWAARPDARVNGQGLATLTLTANGWRGNGDRHLQNGLCRVRPLTNSVGGVRGYRLNRDELAAVLSRNRVSRCRGARNCYTAWVRKRGYWGTPGSNSRVAAVPLVGLDRLRICPDIGAYRPDATDLRVSVADRASRTDARFCQRNGRLGCREAGLRVRVNGSDCSVHVVGLGDHEDQHLAEVSLGYSESGTGRSSDLGTSRWRQDSSARSCSNSNWRCRVRRGAGVPGVNRAWLREPAPDTLVAGDFFANSRVAHEARRGDQANLFGHDRCGDRVPGRCSPDVFTGDADHHRAARICVDEAVGVGCRTVDGDTLWVQFK